MKLSELSAPAGSVREAKRKGRGHGTGNGKTAGKGHKGQIARSGHTAVCRSAASTTFSQSRSPR